MLERMYRDAERKKAVAGRIRQLWEESGYTEQYIADAIGVTLSGYQKQKASGGIKREHLEALAKLHKVDVEWIATGHGKGPTPDVLGTLTDDGADPKVQISRVESIVTALAEDAGIDVSDEALAARAAARASGEDGPGSKGRRPASG